MEEIDDYPFPEKLNNEKDITNAGELPVVLNGYRLLLDRMPDAVYKHELKFYADNKKGEPKELTRGPKNDISRELRNNLQWELYEQMVARNVDFFRVPMLRDNTLDLTAFVYDRSAIFYSIVKLIDNGGTKKFDLTKDGLTRESAAYLQRMENPRAELKATEIVRLKAFRNGIAENRAVAQFLDTLSNQFMVKKHNYYIFANKMMRKDRSINLEDVPHILKGGLQKNVRFVGSSLKDTNPIIQIDAKKSPFFPDNVPLLHFCFNFLGIPNRSEEHRLMQPNNFVKLKKQLRGLTCITTYLSEGQNRTVVIHSLTNEPAKERTFTWNDREVCVKDYFEQKYNLRLNYPNLPCVVERRGQREAYIPLELLLILPGQRVSLSQQTPKLTEQMIKKCQETPSRLQESLEYQRSEAKICNNNPFFQKFGMEVDSRIMNTNAQRLFPPAITYNSDEQNRIECNQQGDFLQDGWKLKYNDNRTFVKPVQLGPRDWAAVNVQKGVAPDKCNQFMKAFIQASKRRGLKVDFPENANIKECYDLQWETLYQMFKYFKDRGVHFLMFFTRDNRDPDSHSKFKLMEQRTGVVTQHITGRIIDKAISNQGSQMVLDNLLMKFNAKNGGCAHTLHTASAFLRANRRGQHDDIVGKQWFGKGRMFFGFEMSHGPPQTLFERQSGLNAGEPSITGMAYTLGPNVMNMRGNYWMQEAKEVIIQYMPERIAFALRSFARHNQGSFPLHLIVYRGGISEGNFSKVAQQERDGFVKAFEIVQREDAEFRPPSLTIIICQRQSNYRMIPTRINSNDKPKFQNVRPGTVVDQDVMHSVLTEFLLIGHEAMQGTAQPLRCSIVFDDSPQRMSLAEMENISYALCYAHGIVTMSVSVPAVLYAAKELAKRGRNNYKTREDEAGPSFSRLKEGQSLDSYLMSLSKDLDVQIDSKFWA